MELVEEYLKLKKKVLDYFKYDVETTYPIYDYTDAYWMVNEEVVRYNETRKLAIFDYYENNLQRANDSVFRADKYTLLEVHQENKNQTELLIFSNEKEIQTD